MGGSSDPFCLNGCGTGDSSPHVNAMDGCMQDGRVMCTFRRMESRQRVGNE